MKIDKTARKMGMMAFPSLGFVALAVAVLLAVPGLAAAQEQLNVPPEGFKSLFNGKDFTGWHMTKRAKEAWFVEDGAFRSLGYFDDFTADFLTEEKFLNFVLMVDYRMLTKSDSGIWFRGWPSDMPRPDGVRTGEQVNLHYSWAVAQPMVFYFGPKNNKMIDDQRKTKVKEIQSEPGIWHSIKITLVGRVLTVEHDGEVVLDAFEYPEGTLSMEPSGIGLQKHKNWDYNNDGNVSNCPIEFRNIFIKDLGSSDSPSETTALPPADPADEAKAALKAYHAALLAGDLEEVVDRFSENFMNDMNVDRPLVRRFFEYQLGRDALDGLEINSERCTFEAIGNLVIISSVTYSLGGESARNSYMMKKEADGKWRFTSESTGAVGRYLTYQWRN
jgi:hypothetical protein